MKSGAQAPAFSLRDENGKLHRLSQYKGQKIVLYFYPKDGTPGCILEAKDFNKEFNRFQEKGAMLLGVSPDNEVSHKRFSEELKLKFPLLADPDGEIATKYGAYGEKEICGSKFESVFRTTFIINEKGRVEKVFQDVKIKGHTKEVLKAL